MGRGDEKASDAMSDILAQVASAADPAAPGGAAVLYECVQTVIGVESVGSLRVLAVNIMGKFLGSRDNNKRYVALGMLQRVVVRDRQAVLRHRATVLECVQDEDDSIRRKALELLGSLVDAKGAPELVDALLSHLSAVEGPFRGELAKRVCLLAQQFPDSAEWYRSVMVRVLRDAGEVVPEEILRVFLTTVGRSPALQAACTPELLTEAERKGAGCPRALALAAAVSLAWHRPRDPARRPIAAWHTPCTAPCTSPLQHLPRSGAPASSAMWRAAPSPAAPAPWSARCWA